MSQHNIFGPGVWQTIYDHSPAQNNGQRLGFSSTPPYRPPQPTNEEDSVIFSRSSLSSSVQFNDIDDSLLTSIDETPIVPPASSRGQSRGRLVPFEDGQPNPAPFYTRVPRTPSSVRIPEGDRRGPSMVQARPWSMSVYNQITSSNNEYDGLMESQRRSPLQAHENNREATRSGAGPTYLQLLGAGVGYSVQSRSPTIQDVTPPAVQDLSPSYTRLLDLISTTESPITMVYSDFDGNVGQRILESHGIPVFNPRTSVHGEETPLSDGPIHPQPRISFEESSQVEGFESSLLMGSGIGYSLTDRRGSPTTQALSRGLRLGAHEELYNETENGFPRLFSMDDDTTLPSLQPSGMLSRAVDDLMELRRSARQLTNQIRKERRKSNPDAWLVIQHIFSHDLWYEKITNDEMINEWLSNLRNMEFDDDVFWFALKILQTSVQGLHIEDFCTWIENVVCPDCRVTIGEEAWHEYCAQFEGDHESRESDEFRAWLADYLDEESGQCEHSRCLCVQPDAKLEDYVVHRSVLSNELYTNLINYINGDTQIHLDPSSCPYIHGVSALRDGTIQHEVEEKDRYAWLPSEFDVDEEGNVILQSRISDLRPEDISIIPLLEQCLSRTLPLFEKVLHRNLRSRRVQVAIEITSIQVHGCPKTPWKLVGLPHERIVATGIHYLDQYNLNGCSLEFRKFVSLDDMTFPHQGTNYSPFHFGAEEVYEGKTNRILGSVECPEGTTVVFPNSLEYRGSMSSDDEGYQNALVFYLVDPDRPVISTEHVLHQIKSDDYEDKSSVTFTPSGMLVFSEALRYYRKRYYKQITKYVFERKFDFCQIVD